MYDIDIKKTIEENIAEFDNQVSSSTKYTGILQSIEDANLDLFEKANLARYLLQQISSKTSVGWAIEYACQAMSDIELCINAIVQDGVR